jgi:YggT family protein
MEAIRFVVDILLWLLMLAFMLRLLLQLVRASFRDPLADAVVRVTNWLVLPLRRILPPIGKVDTATVVAVAVAGLVHAAALALLAGASLNDAPWILRATLVSLLDMVLRIYLFALLLYGLAGFIGSDSHAPGMRLVGQLCEPVLKRVRRLIPPIGKVDFSVLWASIAIGALLVIVR